MFSEKKINKTGLPILVTFFCKIVPDLQLYNEGEMKYKYAFVKSPCKLIRNLCSFYVYLAS